MENSPNPEQPKKIEKERGEGKLESRGSKIKFNPLTYPSSLPNDRGENVGQANRESIEPSSFVSKERKETDVRVFEVAEKPTPNLIMVSEVLSETLRLGIR